jgi:hypothetical protein
MAKEDFPLNIDRRRLLVSAVALPAASVVPGIQCGEPVNLAGAVQPTPSTVPALNVCAATARRLAEIAGRNAIRQEAGLPLLSVVRELRCMKRQGDLEEFERFEAANGRAVWEQLLKPRREAGSTNWPPSWMEGVSLQSRVRKTLCERFLARRVVSV